jgi:hypothetical protein
MHGRLIRSEPLRNPLNRRCEAYWEECKKLGKIVSRSEYCVGKRRAPSMSTKEPSFQLQLERLSIMPQIIDKQPLLFSAILPAL